MDSLDSVVDSLRLQLHQYSQMVQQLLGQIQVAYGRINELQLDNVALLEKLNERNGTCSTCLFQQRRQPSESFSESLNLQNPWDGMYEDGDRLLTYCQNINRLESDRKIKQVRENLTGSPYAIVMFTETSWNNRIISNKLFRNRFSVYRCDRDMSIKQKGGGVLIAVNNKFRSVQLASNRTDIGYEQVWTKVTLGNGQMHVFAVVYFWPGSKREQYERFFRCVQLIMNDLSADGKVHIYGDFNQKNAMFKQSSTNECLLIPEWSVTDSTVSLISDWMQRLGLHQVNRVTNGRGRFLDLLLTNCTERIFVREAPNPLHKNEIDHTAVEYLIAN